MGVTDETIIDTLAQLRRDRHPWFEACRQVRDVYHGDIALPMPELQEAGMETPQTPNLVLLGVDGMAQRIASTVPGLIFPVLGDGARPRADARLRRDVVYGWWEDDLLAVRMYQLARWYTAYAAAVVDVQVCSPHRSPPRPTYVWRDPLASYTVGEPDKPECELAIFTAKRSRAWLEYRYGPMPKGDMREVSPIDMLEVVEYVDRGERVMLAGSNLGAEEDGYGEHGDTRWRRVEQVDNRGDCTPVVAINRMGLSRPIGQFSGMVGMYLNHAEMTALENIAVRRGIFPDVWMVGRQAASPNIIVQADGLRGVIGEVQDADIKVLNEQPGYMTPSTIDRLERAQRLTARIPQEFGGESTSNIRTGRRGDSVMAAVVDFPIQEAQRGIAALLSAANEVAIDVDRSWFPAMQKRMWVGLTGRKAHRVTYTPSVLWVEGATKHAVSYAHPGADANGLAIAGGQRVGMGTMSKQTFMATDPMIEDPDAEADQITVEALEAALLGGIQQQAAQGAIPPGDVARIMQLVADDVDLADAVERAQREAQERQAAQVPASAPEAQPGLAQPGMGVEATTIPEGPQGLTNLTRLMGDLRLGQRESTAEMEGVPVG